MRRILLLAAVPVVALIMVLSSLMLPASARATHPRLPVVQTAYYARGWIRPADNAHWCLTSTTRPKTGDRAFAAPCVTGDAWQQWYAYRIEPPGTGGINLMAFPDVSLTKIGRLWAVRVTGMGSTGTDFLIDFTEYEKGWLLWHDFTVFGRKQPRFITVPSHLVRGTYTAQWNKGASTDKKSQEWLFTAWHKLESVPQR